MNYLNDNFFNFFENNVNIIFLIFFIYILYYKFFRSKNRGLFICFEGIDKVGKTSQSKKLYDILKKKYNNKVILMSFPDRSEDKTGKIIDNFLKCKENYYILNKNGDIDYEKSHIYIHNLFSLNRLNKKNDIENLLNDGYIIICDRYIYSGVCYKTSSYISIKSKDNILDDNYMYNYCKKSLKNEIENYSPIMPDLVFLFLKNTYDDKDLEIYDNKDLEIYEKDKNFQSLTQKLFIYLMTISSSSSSSHKITKTKICQWIAMQNTTELNFNFQLKTIEECVENILNIKYN